MGFIFNSAILKASKGTRIMNKKIAKSKQKNKQQDAERNVRPYLSPAIREAAKVSLRQFQSQSDEAFLIRADINRKLSSL